MSFQLIFGPGSLRARKPRSPALRRFPYLSLILKLVAVGLAMLCLNVGLLQLNGNLHEVIAGQFYRSAQPDAEDIAAYKRRFGIKTIINLRDEPKTDWYEIEEKAARENAITLINFALSSARGPSLAEMQRLLSIMSEAQKPLLVHCEHGSNRTGLATAIYLASLSTARRSYPTLHLSPLYGHIPIPGIGRFSIFRSWLLYRRTLPQ